MPVKPHIVFTLTLASTYCAGQDIIAAADSIRNKADIPELAFAVVSPTGVLQEVYLGHHQTGRSLPVDTAKQSDYFHLGSNTKAITGFVAAYLVEHHYIKWDTRLFNVFVNWKPHANPAYYKVTLRDLLSHRAAIQPYTSGLEYEELPDFKGSKAQRRMQFAEYLLKEKPAQLTDAMLYNYSNAGYTIAAAMLEKATGKTWEQLVVMVLNQKLGLHAKFGWPNKINADEPWGHMLEDDKLTPLPATSTYNLALSEPAGDISMTLPNYIKFIQLNLQGLSGKDNILPAASYRFLHYGLKDYAIGWANDLDSGKKVSLHNGSAGTFYCRVLINGLTHKAYIIIANSGTDTTSEAVHELSELLEKHDE